MLDWFGGDFAEAAEILATAADGLVDTVATQSVDEVWFVPNDPSTSVYTHLALARFMAGDTAGADAAIEQSVATAARLDFPQGPWSHALRRVVSVVDARRPGRLRSAGPSSRPMSSTAARGTASTTG